MAPAAAGEQDQLVDGFLRREGGQHLQDLAGLHQIAEAVGAEQHLAARIEQHALVAHGLLGQLVVRQAEAKISAHVGVAAQVAADHVAVRVVLGFGRGQQAALDGLLHKRVIDAGLNDAAAPHQVETAVADVSRVQPPRGHESGHAGGAHAF